jgi:hypothetical protein
MRIVVNHLTRMQRGYFCLGGIDYETRKHVRPVLERASLPTDLLLRRDNPFNMANIVDLGSVQANPQQPHVEDHVFEPCRATLQGKLPPARFWHFIDTLSETKLRDIFGVELREIGRSGCGTAEGKGKASLGCLRLRHTPALGIERRESGRPQIRITISDGELETDARVTDIRLYEDDRMTPHEGRVKNVARAIRASEGVILSVGLTRAWASSPERTPVHWLQVNNIHLKEHPTSQLR